MTKTLLPSLGLAIALTPAGIFADDAVPQSPREQFSYALGFQIGTQIAQQMLTDKLDLDPEFLAQAIEDVLSGAPAAITPEQMDAAIIAVQQQAEEKSMEKAQAAEQVGKAFRNEVQYGFLFIADFNRAVHDHESANSFFIRQD